MWFGLFLIFVAIPLLELGLLIKVGQSIGFWPTLAIIVLTAAAGVMIMQAHGLRTMQRAMATLQEGGMPVQPVVDGTFVMFAGLLLISPGLMTDVAGLLLLVPPVRRVVSRWCMQRLLASGHVRTWSTDGGSTRQGSTGGSAHERDDSPSGTTSEPAARRWDPKARPGKSRSAGGPVIDGEFVRVDEKTIDPRRPASKPP
jgi:UPF0716 protein FxsA